MRLEGAHCPGRARQGLRIDSTMQEKTAAISVRGKVIAVRSHHVMGRSLVVRGRFLKVASITGEDWLEEEPVSQPTPFISAIRSSRLQADVFTFGQRFSDSVIRHPAYRWHLDNVAAIPLTTYTDWWNGLSQDSRRNVRTAGKRGLRVDNVPFDEKLVRGIKEIYDETPLRQGRPFWHYGKPLECVKNENATYLERSEFLAAYWEDELAGFIKMVRVGAAYSIMQILSKNQHFDKRPPHALIAKAVETCCSKGATHLLYCKHVYGKRHASSITEFKRRLGFQQMNFPRYIIPLTSWGSLALTFGLHRSLQDLLPGGLSEALLNLRERYYRLTVPQPCGKSGRSGFSQSGARSNHRA